MSTMDTEVHHGAGLVGRVVAALRAEPQRLLRHEPLLEEPLLCGPPQPMAPEVLTALTLPSGRALSPSLRRWLEFDTAMLARSGWLASSRSHRFTPRSLDMIAAAEWGDEWGGYYAPLAAQFGECFLLPGGSDSRRVLATGQTDEFGEYPVFAIDIDDQPYVGLMYPGLDVYLAHILDVVEHEHIDYESLIDDPVYSARMRQHAQNWFDGETFAEHPF
jgi:hypothetical protein